MQIEKKVSSKLCKYCNEVKSIDDFKTSLQCQACARKRASESRKRKRDAIDVSDIDYSGTKTCCRCKEEKNKTEFYINKISKDFLSGYCKPCEKKVKGKNKKSVNKSYYEKNKNSIREYKKDYSSEYHAKHKEVNKTRVKDKNKFKTCACCGETKDETKFSLNRRLKDGLNTYCSVCNTRKKEKWKKENKERVNDNAKKRYHKNKHKINKRYTERVKQRRKKDPVYNAKMRARKNVAGAHRGYQKRASANKLLGCSYEFLLGWLPDIGDTSKHIDHIVPINWARTIEQVEALCHYTNTRMLDAKENISRRDKFTGCEAIMVIASHPTPALIRDITSNRLFNQEQSEQ